MATRRVVGCMSGTSIDAIDAALVAIDGRGMEIRAVVERCVTHPLGSLVEPLRDLASLEPISADRIAKLARDLALGHVTAIRNVSRTNRIDLISIHGQTVFHAPPVSWQLLAPAPIAEAFAVPVVCDLRAADLAAGGEGAPITPLADYILFRSSDEARAIVNLGGFANYTLLPRSRATAEQAAEDVEAIRGGDICACNQILDRIARDDLGKPFDADGQHAATGRVVPEIRDSLVTVLRSQAADKRSLGTGDELAGWIERHRPDCRGEDLARSACEALSIVITGSIDEAAGKHGLKPIDRLLLAGGGVKHRVLLASLTENSRAKVALTDAYGVPATHREAAAMAVLGALCQDRVAITLPQVTNVRRPAPIAGAWIYPLAR